MPVLMMFRSAIITIMSIQNLNPGELNLKGVSSQDDPFDTNLEEAVGEANSAEPPGTIAEEVSAGYKLHGKVIRAVRVKISTGQ